MRPLIANIVNAIRSSGAPRAASVREMRADTRSALTQHRQIRRAAARAVRQTLRRHRAAVIASLRAAFVGPGSTAAADGTVVDRETRAPSGSPPAVEHTSVWELWPDSRGREDATYELLQALRVIQSHPEGICARDIGNELGIDWRRVPGLTRSLLEAGVIEQVEQDFYPTGKAAAR
jgi:hypothetical protein